MFYHPAVRWISNCIREEREQCCDDIVLRVCRDRVVYATALAALEELRPRSPQLAFAASARPLLARIRRLIGASAPDQRPTAREIAGLAVLVVGVVMIVAGLGLFLTSSTFQGVARIKIEPDKSAQLTSNDGKLELTFG